MGGDLAMERDHEITMKLMCAQTGWMCWFFHRKTNRKFRAQRVVKTATN